jgi:hypothetical protein
VKFTTTILLTMALFIPTACSSGDDTDGTDAPQTAPPAAAASQSRTIADVGFASPETVLWDTIADVYLVSNINGKPGDEDNNGFIARVAPDGSVLTLKWIAGGQNGVTLHGPKGMIFRGDTLFAVDVGGVRLFDRTTGKPLGTWPVDTKGLNGIALGPNGDLYATDLQPPPSGDTPAAPPAAIYRLTGDGGQAVVQGDAKLTGPDGILAYDHGFIVAPFGGNQLYRVSDDGTKTVLATLPGGKLDGLIALPDGGWAVTSWDASGVFRVAPDGTVTPLVQDIDSPAQLELDTRRNVLLIPSFNANAVEVRALPGG